MLATNAATICLFIIVWGTRKALEKHGTTLDVTIYSGLLARWIGVYFMGNAKYWTLGRLLQISGGLLTVTAFSLLLYVGYNLATFRSESTDPTDQVPFICPSRTSHTRLFPTKHSFSYSYLLVAVPIGWKGRIGSLISVDSEEASQREPSSSRIGRDTWTWMDIRASDYLSRGQGELGLQKKLALYLSDIGEDMADYSSSWLVTAPRFLGYSFNPVSFWYLYKGARLDAMILEVNNTFDERRMYFMKGGDIPPKFDGPETEGIDGPKSTFKQQWVKDFHVSPFNSRKGSYSLSANDPGFLRGADVDNTITLKSSKDHVKLVARIFTSSPSFKPNDVSITGKARFITSWFWVGFVTFPRILKEAFKLFFLKKLNVWFRPEVLQGSIGRKPSQREMVVAKAFRAYLHNSAESSQLAVGLKYASPSMETFEEVFHTPLSATLADPPVPVDFTILTPQFYSDFVLKSDPQAYVASHPTRDQKDQTFHASNVQILSSILQSLNVAKTSSIQPTSYMWRVLAILRRSKIEHPLDAFARTRLPRDQSTEYRGAVTGLLVAQYICGGIPELIDLILTILRIYLCFTTFLNLISQISNEGASIWNSGSLLSAAHIWLITEERTRG